MMIREFSKCHHWYSRQALLKGRAALVWRHH
jgi:hypothetical protein